MKSPIDYLKDRFPAVAFWLKATVRTGPGHALILSLSSLIIELFAVYGTYYSMTNPKDFVLIIGLTIAIALSFAVATAIRALYTLDADTFADVLISDESSERVIQSISREVFKVCDEFCDLAAPYFVAGNIHNSNLQFASSNGKKVSSELESLSVKQFRQIRRIFAAKHRVSKMLDIPTRRLCDHLLQFSPQIYEGRLNRFSRNYGERMRMPLSPDRKLSLNRSLARITYRMYQHKMWADQLIRYGFLIEDLVKVGAALSTGAALRSYLLCFYRAYEKCKTDDELIAVFEFIYHKRGVHKGFDLHRLAMNMFNYHGSINTGAARHVERKVLFDQIRNRTLTTYNLRIESSELRKLVSDFNRLLDYCRENERNGLVGIGQTVLKARFTHNQIQSILLVVHGYSKTVRQLIKKSVTDVIFRSFRGQYNDFRIFLLDTVEGEGDSLSIRKLRFDLREDLVFFGTKNYKDQQMSYNFSKHLICGNMDYLLSVLRNKMQVSFIIGAEAFSENGSKIQAIHEFGLREHLGELRGKIKKSTLIEPRVYLIAERFKKIESDLLRDVGTYSDYFGPVDIYCNNQGQLIDEVITNV